jgi:hypothetical protein
MNTKGNRSPCQRLKGISVILFSRHAPAPQMSFTQPNLPELIHEIETLIEKE